MAGKIVMPTTCKVCGEQFVTPSILVIGQNDQQRLQEFGGKLAGHIMTKHKEVAIAAAALHQQFDGMLTMMNFHIGDEGLGQQLDAARYQIHRLTRRAVINDETLMRKVSELGLLSAKDEEKVLALFVEMRNVMEERGRFPELEPTGNGQNPGNPR